MSTGREITRTEGQEIERTRERPTVAPPVDIYDNDDEVLVVADVPGVAQDGVTLDFDKGRLSIEASATTRLPEGTALFREHGDVDYRRVFEVAPGIDADKISAELRAGTLTIHLPKAAALKPRQIPISGE